MSEALSIGKLNDTYLCEPSLHNMQHGTLWTSQWYRCFWLGWKGHLGISVHLATQSRPNTGCFGKKPSWEGLQFSQKYRTHSLQKKPAKFILSSSSHVMQANAGTTSDVASWLVAIKNAEISSNPNHCGWVHARFICWRRVECMQVYTETQIYRIT